MTRNTLHKLVSGSILMLLPLMVQAQIALKNWTIEDHSGEAFAACKKIAGVFWVVGTPETVQVTKAVILAALHQHFHTITDFVITCKALVIP